MILYLTKKTFERYNLISPDKYSLQGQKLHQVVKKAEEGNRLLEWGGKIFYFDKRKCIQVMNFASKFTLFLFDIKVKDLCGIGDLIYRYLMEFYYDNKEMSKLLVRLSKEHPFVIFDKLKDKSTIAALNYVETFYADYGYLFYKYFEGNILQTIKINDDINKDYLFTTKIEGKSTPDYFYSGERFVKLLKEYYAKINNKDELNAKKSIDIA